MCILIICVLKCTRLFKKANAAFDQERGFQRRWGWGGKDLPSPLMAFLTYMLKTYSRHTDISHVGGQLAYGLFFGLYMNNLVNKISNELFQVGCQYFAYSYKLRCR